MASAESSPTSEGAPPRPWIRGVYMVVFLVCFAVAESVLALMAVIQFGWLIAYREPQPTLQRFGAALAQWLRDVVRFQTAATEDRPFPWSAWPKGE